LVLWQRRTKPHTGDRGRNLSDIEDRWEHLLWEGERATPAR